jgi:hypothetical protein
MGSFGSELLLSSNIKAAFCRLVGWFVNDISPRSSPVGIRTKPKISNDISLKVVMVGGLGRGHDVACFTAYHLHNKCRIVFFCFAGDSIQEGKDSSVVTD